MNKDRLRAAREKSGLTQIELAKIVGLSRTTYNNYETTKREPDDETLVKIAKALNCTVGYLLDAEPEDLFEYCPVCGHQYNKSLPPEDRYEQHRQIHKKWLELSEVNMWLSPQSEWLKQQRRYYTLGHGDTGVVIEYLRFQYSLSCILWIESGSAGEYPSFKAFVSTEVSSCIFPVSATLRKQLLREIDALETKARDRERYQQLLKIAESIDADSSSKLEEDVKELIAKHKPSSSNGIE